MENKNFSTEELGILANIESKVFLKDQLGLTGCEVSFGAIPVGQEAPFLHAHKENEEIYIFLQGDGIFLIDGKKFPVKEGSVVKVAPAGIRGLKSNSNNLVYVCIQAKEGSLTQATADDGIILEEKP